MWWAVWAWGWAQRVKTSAADGGECNRELGAWAGTALAGCSRTSRGSAAACHAARPFPGWDRQAGQPCTTCIPACGTRRTEDNRVCVLAIPKATWSEHWRCLFQGDSEGVRCMQQPYTLSGGQQLPPGQPVGATWLPDEQAGKRAGGQAGRPSRRAVKPVTAWRRAWRRSGPEPLAQPAGPPSCAAETQDDVLLELELPFWIEREDVAVEFGREQLRVGVHNTLQLMRTYWRDRWAACGPARPSTQHPGLRVQRAA